MASRDTQRTAREGLPDSVAEGARQVLVDDVVGADEWKRSKIGYLTGVGALRSGVGSFVENGREAVDRVRNLGRKAFENDASGVAVDAEDPAVRFREAMIANRKTESDIASSLNVTTMQFRLYAALLAFALVLGLGGLLVDGSSIPMPFGILFRLTPVPVLGALLLRAGYTNWMFRTRRFGSLQEYVRSGDLLPRKAESRTRGLGRKVGPAALMALAGTFAVLALAFSGTDVLAQTTTSTSGSPQQVFTNGPTSDLFVRLLSYVIPNVGPLPASEFPNMQQDLIKKGFMIFSSLLMFIAAGVGGYQIIAGLVASAKEGTALGKSYHEVWAPIRVVVGFGFLTPIAGGLCAAQILVLYLIVWGGNLANLVWKPYVAGAVQTMSAMYSPSSIQASGAMDLITAANDPIASKHVKEFFEKELCTANENVWRVRNGASKNNYPQVTTSALDATVNWKLQITSAKYRWEYGNCGSIDLTVPMATDTVESKTGFALASAQVKAIQAFQPKLASLANEVVQTYQSPLATSPKFFTPEAAEPNAKALSILQDARRTYLQSMQQGAVQAANAASTSGGGESAKLLDDVSKSANDQGWASAGVFYLTMVRVNQAFFNYATQRGEATDIDNRPVSTVNSAIDKFLYGTPQESGALTAFRGWWDANLSTIAPAINGQALSQAAKGDSWDIVTDTMMVAVKWFDGNSIQPPNAMQNMITFGTRLEYSGFAVVAAMSAVGDAGSKAGGVAGAISNPVLGLLAKVGMGIVTPFLTIANFAGYALIAAGILHAYVLPSIPYIMSVFFVGAMLVLTSEALIAAPLWAFFHVRMDGHDGFVDQVQRPGYMIAFNLILRPSLMIFGLILSNLVFGGMAWFVAQTFYPAAKGLSGSTTIGPIGAVVMIIIVSFIHYQVAVHAFQLITKVPDRVTRWFGQGGENLDEDSHTKNITGIVGQQVTNRIEGATRGASMRQAIGGSTGVPGKAGTSRAGQDAASASEDAPARKASASGDAKSDPGASA